MPAPPASGGTDPTEDTGHTARTERTEPTARAALAAALRRRRTRCVLVCTALGLAAVALVLVGLATGPYPLSPGELARILAGGPEATGGGSFVFWRLRAPTVALGVLAGAAFALSGALFQTLVRNPLASPDILGISGGASVAAVFGLLVLGVSGIGLSLLALAGGFGVALAIYALAWRGGVGAYRFVLVGVGFAFAGQAVLGYLISRGDVREVSRALAWTVGGIGGARWDSIAVLAVALAILLPALALTRPALQALQLGDPQAGGLGVRVERTRLGILALGVTLAALTTAVTGPIAFVAFIGPPIARSLVRDGGPALVAAALTGVCVVLGADAALGAFLPDSPVPVGIVTGAIGAPYLLWLLATGRS
ncbi:FecCD family ABC transporter permease [Pseudactinotalea sp. HY160]|uniref:FecCD family ABC transporter permease n=1 Tax=Pseudactinotalea sp. HY160 TaxID=2654490 RepID=UPI00351BC06C